MPRSLRVLLVDDSAFIRQVLTRLIDAEPDLAVCGTARDGKVALRKIAELEPDLVVLDVEMPVMNGTEALQQIRRDQPRLPVVMFSAFTKPGVRITIDALLYGASDYVLKPSGNDNVVEEVRRTLIPKIRQHGRLASPIQTEEPYEDPVSSGSIPILDTTAKPVRVVVIAVSTGGPQALLQLFSDLPADLGVPVLIVQHMLPSFLPHLAYRLSAKSSLVVKLAEHGRAVSESPAWIAPGDQHLTVSSSQAAPTLALSDGLPINSCRPAADLLFRSAASIYGSGVLGVVLTGMGRDGLDGSRAVVAAGGSVLTQDESSSVIYGMPRVVAEAGLSAESLPLDAMARAIVSRVRGV